MKLVFATGNAHKLKEISSKLSGEIELISMREIGFVGEIEETGTTLEQNALLKAEYISNNFNIDCFADDTGLEIAALNGKPGVYSARFAGENCSFEDNVNKTLSLMAGKENRKACFRTIICHLSGNETTYFEGKIEGEITTEVQGKDGFGYDPIFRPNGFDKTFAEMTLAEKNEISHRAIAVNKLVSFLSKS